MANGHVGPVIMADETAREQLLNEGEVVSFRQHDRTTGETWWRQSRTGPKCGEVLVEQLGECDPSELSELEPYGAKSGFNSARAWQTAIATINGDLSDGYLYRISQI